eukprot:1492277-Amphidinium_carterae.1
MTVMVYVDDLLLLGEDDKINDFLKQLERQLQLKHVTKLEREQPLVYLGRQIEYYNDHIALSMTKVYYNSLLSLYNIKDNTYQQFVYYRHEKTSYYHRRTTRQRGALDLQHNRWQTTTLLAQSALLKADSKIRLISLYLWLVYQPHLRLDQPYFLRLM